MRTIEILKSSLRKAQATTATTRRRRTAAETLRRRRRVARARACFRTGERRRRRRSFSSSTAASKLVNNWKVSDKLEVLKNLIPSSHFNRGRGCEEDGDDDQTVKTEQLFQETADYIILLRSRIAVLQRLIEFYGSENSSRENQDDNSVNVLL